LTSSTSSGFTKRMLATVAFSSSAAFMLGATIEPKARIATLLALALDFALADLDRGQLLLQIAAPMPAPRG
jgi:hypothetical protein